MPRRVGDDQLQVVQGADAYSPEIVGVALAVGLELQGLARGRHPRTIALLDCGLDCGGGIIKRNTPVLRMQSILIVAVHLPASRRVDVTYDARGFTIGGMWLARVVSSVRVLLSVAADRATERRRHVAIASKAVKVGASSQRPDLVTAPQGRRQRSSTSTGKLDIVQHRTTVRNEGVTERQGRELFDTSEGEQRIWIIVGRLGGDSFAFRQAVGELLVVDVDCFQPGG
eukprot:1635852-Pleurochrysis_carterae.AAC.4